MAITPTHKYGALVTTSSATQVSSSQTISAGAGVVVGAAFAATAGDLTANVPTCVFSTGSVSGTLLGFIAPSELVGQNGAAAFYFPPGSGVDGATGTFTVNWGSTTVTRLMGVEEYLPGAGENLAKAYAHLDWDAELASRTARTTAFRQPTINVGVYVVGSDTTGVTATAGTGYAERYDANGSGGNGCWLTVGDDVTTPTNAAFNFASGAGYFHIAVALGPVPNFPYYVGQSVLFEGISTTATPVIPSTGAMAVANGDLVIVDVWSKDNATLTAPASEGWNAIGTKLTNGATFQSARWAKIWGIGGQTDDTTPTFTKGAGTNGVYAVASIFRNPNDGTTRWAANLSDSVIGSAESANSAAATTSCPSAAYTDPGTAMTFVRMAASADDNALNAPSEGGWCWGDTPYDTTTGTDTAGAMSAREGVTGGSSTSTATFAESRNGNDVSNGRTLVLAIAAGGGPVTVNLGLPSETDSALALTASKLVTLGLPAETDSALAVTASKVVSLGIATETDAGLPVTGSKIATIGLPVETDTGLPVTPSWTFTLGGFGSETDTVPGSITASKLVTLGIATETDSGLLVTVSGGAPVSTASRYLRRKRR